MQTISNTPLTLKLLGAVVALALLAAAALAVALTTGPAAAQTPDNIYDDPQPCGPGAQTAYQPEPHEITEGHFALFDAYWEWRVQDPNDENVGLLHTNLCPPLVVETTEFDKRGRPITVTSLVDSNIDINEAIFHVLDKHKVTVVEADQYDPAADELPSDQYVELVADEHIGVGSQVWWLRLDDPNTDVDETSDLVLGFSSKRFDNQYWGDARDGGPAFRYKFELERDPGIDPGDDPHLFVYKAREEGASEAEIVWSSAEADVKDLETQPGELEDLQWIFTQPGTYEIWVHLQGWVRHEPPTGAGPDWRPISEYTTVTSEVKRYVFQVGDTLEETEPPRFGVSGSVAENSPGGTPVGDPITVFSEVEELEYRLSGEGSEQFDLIRYAGPHSVQIVVAEGAQLDYETKASYDLTLGVTDNVDHEHNADDSLDDTLTVRIDLTDVPTTAFIEPDKWHPVAGDTVTFTAVLTDFGEGHDVTYYFTDSQGVSAGASPNHSVRHTGPTAEQVGLRATYQVANGPSSEDISHFEIEAPSIIVTWGNP